MKLSQINEFDKFWKMDCRKIIHILQNSIIVTNNTPYYMIQINKVTSKYNKKKDMIILLIEYKIPHNQNMNKYELLEVIQKCKKKEETFKINEIIKLERYSILRLSSYIYDFIKSGLKKNNLFQKIMLLLLSNTLKNLIYRTIENITEDWTKSFEENRYFNKPEIKPSIV